MARAAPGPTRPPGALRYALNRRSMTRGLPLSGGVSARVGTRDGAARNLRRGVDPRVTRVGDRPSMGLVPREAVHLLRGRVVRDAAVAVGVRAAEPVPPLGGDSLLAGGHRGLLDLRPVQSPRL